MASKKRCSTVSPRSETKTPIRLHGSNAPLWGDNIPIEFRSRPVATNATGTSNGNGHEDTNMSESLPTPATVQGDKGGMMKAKTLEEKIWTIKNSLNNSAVFTEKQPYNDASPRLHTLSKTPPPAPAPATWKLKSGKDSSPPETAIREHDKVGDDKEDIVHDFKPLTVHRIERTSYTTKSESSTNGSSSKMRKRKTPGQVNSSGGKESNADKVARARKEYAQKCRDQVRKQRVQKTKAQSPERRRSLPQQRHQMTPKRFNPNQGSVLKRSSSFTDPSHKRSGLYRSGFPLRSPSAAVDRSKQHQIYRQITSKEWNSIRFKILSTIMYVALRPDITSFLTESDCLHNIKTLYNSLVTRGFEKAYSKRQQPSNIKHMITWENEKTASVEPRGGVHLTSWINLLKAREIVPKHIAMRVAVEIFTVCTVGFSPESAHQLVKHFAPLSLLYSLWDLWPRADERVIDISYPVEEKTEYSLSSDQISVLLADGEPFDLDSYALSVSSKRTEVAMNEWQLTLSLVVLLLLGGNIFGEAGKPTHATWGIPHERKHKPETLSCQTCHPKTLLEQVYRRLVGFESSDGLNGTRPAEKYAEKILRMEKKNDGSFIQPLRVEYDMGVINFNSKRTLRTLHSIHSISRSGIGSKFSHLDDTSLENQEETDMAALEPVKANLEATFDSIAKTDQKPQQQENKSTSGSVPNFIILDFSSEEWRKVEEQVAVWRQYAIDDEVDSRCITEDT